MHMTGMENFNMQSKRAGGPMQTSTSNGGSTQGDSQINSINTKGTVLDAMKGNKKNTPAVKSGTQQAYTGKNPGTANMDQREKKIYEIYASGKPNMGPIGAQFGGNQANSGQQNSFMQNKY